MDALTITESRDPGHFPLREGFRSVNEGYCHACGHDGHTATGLGLAEVLLPRAGNLSGKIKLIFQPGEEGGCGAKGIVEAGVLDDVDYFFAIHVGLTKLDGRPLGSHGLICGVKDFLDSRGFNFKFTGKPAHPVGDPHVGKNALLAACSAALAIHNIAPHSEGICRANVGVLNAGTVRNAIASSAFMMVDIRGQNDLVAEYIQNKVLSAAKGAALMYENELEIEPTGAVISASADDSAMEIVRKCAQRVDWFDEIHFEGSMGGSDDAAEMLRRVQKNGGIGSYIGLGADFAAGFHHHAFDFDEEVMVPSIKLLAEIVGELLKLKN
ncbi:MAG: amidohydrolase [Synergistaceae bacterium]|jgi:aminobenzoyl-glutamate utilization protein A|nr:amidohydrolase [Synergistaceae bacterium]